MKKTILTLLLTAGTAQASDWYAGLTAGQSFGSNSGTIGFNDGTDTASEKKNFDGKQFFTGSLFFGRSITFKDQGNILIDFAYQYNNEKASGVSTTTLSDTKVTMERPSTFMAGFGFERPITSDISLFLKAGIAMSHFKTKLDDRSRVQLFNGTNTQWKWGFIPTFGIQKDIAGMTLGLSYSYAMYQEFTASKVNLTGGREYTNKIAPRYHIVEARISKKF